MNNITIFRRDYKTLTVTVTDDQGNAFDLTGYTARFTAKKHPQDIAQAISTITGVIASPVTGGIEFVLTSNDTNLNPGSYWFDVEISKPNDVQTVCYGKLEIIQDITT